MIGKAAVFGLGVVLGLGTTAAVLEAQRGPDRFSVVEVQSDDLEGNRPEDQVAIALQDDADEGDGDGTRGDDGTGGGLSGDRDRTAGNDGTRHGNNTGDSDRTVGNDGTGGGDNTGGSYGGGGGGGGYAGGGGGSDDGGGSGSGG
jgi:hypothetical protein